jgi:hypothetical protein
MAYKVSICDRSRLDRNRIDLGTTRVKHPLLRLPKLPYNCNYH